MPSLPNTNYGLALQRKDLLFDAYVCSNDVFHGCKSGNPPHVDPLGRALSLHDAKDLIRSYGVRQKNLIVRFASKGFLHKDKWIAFEKKYGMTKRKFHDLHVARAYFSKLIKVIDECPSVDELLTLLDDDSLRGLFRQVNDNADAIKVNVMTIIDILDEQINKVDSKEENKDK